MNKAILTAAVVGLATAMISVPALASDTTARNPNSISPRPPGGNGGYGGNGGSGGNTTNPRPTYPRPGGGGGTGPHA